MADIDVQQRGSMTWLWWLIGLIVLALIAWALLSRDEERVAMEPATEQPIATDVREPVGRAPSIAAPGLPIGQILASPNQWIGRSVDGQAEVVEVPTQGGFWVEHLGERLFTVVEDEPGDMPVQVSVGQVLDLDDAEVHEADYFTEPSAARIDPRARSIAEGQPVFLVVDADDVHMADNRSPAPR